MGYIRANFLGKEYSIPEDILTYIDLLSFTDGVKTQLVKVFVYKLKNEIQQGNAVCLGDADMASDIGQQVGKFIAKLTDRGIYDRTVNDYLRKNEGYKLISKVNAAALEEAKRVLKQEMSDWLEGYEDAIYKKESSVTGLGFSIWSSSFVNHAIYAAMEASKVNEQEKAAAKAYQKDMAELEARLQSRKTEDEKRYVAHTYIPNMEAAITVFSYELLDTFISDLIQYGKLDKEVLNYVHIDRSNDLLKNLGLSQNKEAVLLKAFEACPYNIAVYMQAMKYDLLDYESFQTATLFNHGRTIITFLEENLGGTANSEKKQLNFKNAELLSLYSSRDLREITAYMADFVVDGYAQIIAALSDTAPCYGVMNKVEERAILAGESISKQKADWLVDPLAPAVLWDKLTAEYGHFDLFDRLLNLLPDRPELNNKQEYDTFLKNRLFSILETIRQERVAKIHEQQREEARRKEEEAERARRTAKRNKLIKIICLIAVVIAIVIAIISSVITKANNAKAYQEMAGEFCVYRVINDDGEERDYFNWWLSIGEDGTMKMSSWSYAIDHCDVDSYSGSLKNKADFRKFEDYRIEDFCADASEYEKAKYCYEFHIADEWDEFDGYIVCWQYPKGKIVDVYCDDYRYSFVETGDDYSFYKWEKEIDSDGLSENVKDILDSIVNSKHEEVADTTDVEYDEYLTWYNVEFASSFLGKELNADGSLSMGPGDYETLSNDMYLFDIPGRCSHGWSSADSDPVIIDILDWVTTKPVDDFNKILTPLIKRYGDGYRVQPYDDAAGDAYMWKNVEMYEYIICWQNTVGTVDIRWIFDDSKDSNNTAITEGQNTTSESNSSGTEKIVGGTEAEIKAIIEILSGNVAQVKETYSCQNHNGNDLLISGTFAGLDGSYVICCYDDGSIWRVTFKRHDKEIDTQQVIDSICDYLGDYLEYDTERNKYEWVTDEIELMFYVEERIYFDLP